ncbi:MAG: CHAD domain-containing protein [Acidimicrobiales bacterium]
MTSEPLEDDDNGSGPFPAGRHGQRMDGVDLIPEPTAGMVLHRVLAMSARAFLLNDQADELDGGPRGTGTVDALSLNTRTKPLWAQSTVEPLAGADRCDDPTERIHQSRVAMRQIRSNLRTFRLLLDPAWGTALRAELAWYGDELGRSRDLDLLALVVSDRGPEALDADEVARLLAVVDWRRDEVAARIAAEQASPRRVRLTEQMMVLWEGPQFKAKAAKPAAEILAPMLHRSWRDVRGAGRTAKKDPTDVNLHQLRIRLKDLRYGCETLTLVEGGPAAKTAKSAKNLQNRLGDLHDTVVSIDWLEALASEQPDLADAAKRLAAVQRDVAADNRKGWKRGLKDVERRWRRWQG